MTHLEPIDSSPPDFGDFFDELPLWSAPFGLLLLERVPMRRDQAILDVGAGTGFLTVELAQRCRGSSVVAVDPWEAAVRRLRRKLEFLGLENVRVLQCDGAAMDVPEASIDLVVSNLGINNFENADAVLEACHRAARPGAGLFLTTNLVGTMAEFYDVFRETLVEMGQSDRLEALERQVRHRATVESATEQLERAGFGVREVTTRTFPMRFAGGSSLLRHWFIRLGFLPGWRSVVEDAAVFERLEENLDRRGELSLTVPMACLEAVRR